MIEAVLGALALIAVTVIGYIFGRKKNTSEIKKNEADTKKSVIEAEKLDTENKIMQVGLFDKLNRSLAEQNEKLLESNEKAVKSNDTLIAQNKKLLKHVSGLEERLGAVELELKNTRCTRSAECPNRTT